MTSIPTDGDQIPWDTLDQAIDRRAATRHAVGSVRPIQLYLWDDSGAQQDGLPADILDLSLGGAALLLQTWSTAHGAGASVGLDVRSHPDFEQAMIQATVRWLEPVSTALQACWLIGIQFDEPLPRLPHLLSC
ncbi:MAG: PilZ domain-containing protein [Cyanobacteriota bacterium]|jgi:PilZ domain|nr:PilZ domain-containing protein [Cyanobacteriota bacterium]